jgi:putative oxidoreductase
MLMHGVAKIQHGTSGIATMLERKGLPSVLALGVFVGEVLAPIAIIVGLFTRPAAIVFAFNMLVATWLVHAGDVARLSTTGGWKIELQALYFFGAVCVALLGSGRFAVSRGRGPWWL